MMFRRTALAALASAAALVAACGHQVTPEPSLNGQGNNLAGSILVRFSTAQAMNFAMYDYQIVIDACGGSTPYPIPANTSFLSYTFSFNIGTTQTFGASTIFPILLQYIVTPGVVQNALNPQIVRTSVSETTLTPNDNGQNNEFTLTFPRALLYNPLGPTQLPCNGALASPTPVPTGATPSPTPTATSTATGTSSPSPSPTPIGSTNLASTWKFNFFVINAATGQVLDSLGSGGPTDNTYSSPLVDTTTTKQYPIIKQPDLTGAPSDPAAQIGNGEIDNYQ